MPKHAHPSSPDDNTQTQKFAQEFVDALNRAVLKEDEKYNKDNSSAILPETKIAQKSAKSLKKKLEEAGAKPSYQHGAVILPQRPPFKGPEVNIPTRKASLDVKAGIQKPTAFFQFFRTPSWGLLGVIVSVLLLVLFLIDRVVLMKVEARCLEAGYADAKVAWYINGYEGYCVVQGYVIPAPNFKR